MNDAPAVSPDVKPKELKVLKTDVQLSAARYSPCGKTLAAPTLDGRVLRWEVSGEDITERAAVTGHHGWCTAVAFGSDGETAFSADSHGKICAWPFAAEAPQPKWSQPVAHDGWVRDLAVSPDGGTLATCGKDKKVRLWSTADGAKRAEWDGDGDVYCLAFAPDGGSLFTGDDRGVIRRRKPDGELIREYAAAELYTLSRLQDVGGVRCLAIARDGKSVFAGGTIPKGGATITGVPLLLAFDVESGAQTQRVELGDATQVNVVDLYLHADGYVAVVTNGSPGQGQLLLWRPGEKEPFFKEKKMANIQSLSFRSDGNQFALVATNGGSNGNGRVVKDGKYVNNFCPVHVWSLR